MKSSPARDLSQVEVLRLLVLAVDRSEIVGDVSLAEASC